MRARMLGLLALVPGLAAAQSFTTTRLPSLDLSPNRWLKSTRSTPKPALFTGSKTKTKTKTPAKNMFRSPAALDSQPCAVDLRLAPPAEKSETKPCGAKAAANERK